MGQGDQAPGGLIPRRCGSRHFGRHQRRDGDGAVRPRAKVGDSEVVNKEMNVPAREAALGGSCDLSQQSSECLSQGEIAIDILVLSKLLQVAPNVTRNFQHFDRNSRLAAQFLLKRSGQGQQEIIGRRPLD